MRQSSLLTLILVIIIIIAGVFFYNAYINDGEDDTIDTAQEVNINDTDLTDNENSNALENESDETIAGVLAEDDRFDTASLAIETSGIDETLASTSKTYTVFAPTDEAFTKVQSTIDRLIDDRDDQLATIVRNHIVEGRVNVSQLSDGQTLRTLSGESLRVSVSGDTIKIGEATILESDIRASNGVIHAVDVVIIPDVPANTNAEKNDTTR
jgi:transforming growth factor-beta-induced protein